MPSSLSIILVKPYQIAKDRGFTIVLGIELRLLVLVAVLVKVEGRDVVLVLLSGPCELEIVVTLALGTVTGPGGVPVTIINISRIAGVTIGVPGMSRLLRSTGRLFKLLFVILSPV